MNDTIDAPPPVSAAVLNFNGGQMVLECLASLQAQDPPAAEIICVDNYSTDGSPDRIQALFPGVRLVRLSHNLGFAGGMNRAIAHTSSELVALINLDVTLEPDYLARCARVLHDDPKLGGVTGKLLRPGPDPGPDQHGAGAAGHSPLLPVIDTTGHTVFRNRRAVDRGEREPDRGQYDSDTRLFSICGAAPVYRRRMLDEVRLGADYFDEDFFAYFEDFDLSWRAQLRGWGFGYVPDAEGRHHRGGSGGKQSTFILACNHRNRLLVILHNDSPAAFVRHLPGIAYTELRATLHMLSLRPAALLLAWWDLLRLLPGQISRRRQIQRERTVSWQELEPWFVAYDYRISTVFRRARQRAMAR